MRTRRIDFIVITASLFITFIALACTSRGKSQTIAPTAPQQNSTNETAPVNSMPVVHVFVALADNEHQGIVPVSKSLGDGDNTKTNLYWGAAFGVKTFFAKSRDWELLSSVVNPTSVVLERCTFKHRRQNLYVIADAYRGREIAQATWDFLAAAAGQPGYALEVKQEGRTVAIHSGGSAEVLAYMGHDGLMDFKLPPSPKARDQRPRQAIILACASKQYFSRVLEATGAKPLLWTTNLMAPESYILSAALDGWIKHESDEQIRLRAAVAYNQYQKCGLKAASNLFATGW